MPHATAQSVGSNLHQTGFAQKEPMNSEAITRNLVTGRAKSAGPVMCRSEVLTKETTTLPKGEREKGLHLSSETNRSEDGGTHAAAVTGNGTEHTEEHNPDLLYGAERHTDSVENTEEDFPYLTIGIKLPTECCEDHGYDNEGKTPLTEKIQRKFVRVKTWPPTAIQWARQQAKQDDTVIDVCFFQKLQAELRLGKQDIPNVNFQPVSPSGGSPTNDPESLSMDVPLSDTDKARVAEESPGLGLDDETWKGDGTLPDSDHLHYHVIDAEPDQSILNTLKLETAEVMADGSNERLEMGITTQKIEEPDQYILNTPRLDTTEGMADGSHERLEMGITTQKIEEPDQSILNMFETTQGMADSNIGMRLEMDITTQKTEEESSSEVKREKSRTGTSQSKRRPRESSRTKREGSQADKSTTGASVLPKPGSPGDESLLRDNEYVFIDLLHEVVENRGRWTRERWRQSHLNRKKFQLK